MIKSFKMAYPGINTYLEEVVKDCKAKGYVQTIFGRRR
jgi:DNA polymerase I-like protein with 3'-5' exonuclease and polymerase domains